MNIDQLRSAVFNKQKTLGAIYKTYGSLSLANYAVKWQVPTRMGAEYGFFLELLCKRAEQLHGKQAANLISQELLVRPLVSTVDHHGIFGHPFFLNSNLIYSLYPGLKALICLPTAGVSLNNNTSWSGCLLLTDSNGRLCRWSLFPDRVKTNTVFSTRPFAEADVKRALEHFVHSKVVSGSGTEKIVELVEKIFLQPAILGLPDFSDQATVVSRLLWNNIFPQAPELLYVPLEQLISKFITEYLANRPEHVLHKLFFTPVGWGSIARHFQGAAGAFTGVHKGSFLFWGIDNKGRRMHFSRQGSRLVSAEWGIPGETGSIAELLQSGKLYPGSLSCFLVLLYCGLTCLGGFNQVNWLTDIKQKFVDLLLECGEKDEAERISQVVTNNFAEASIVTQATLDGIVFKPSALDVYLLGAQAFNNYHALARSRTLQQSIDAELPEIYRIITPAGDRA